MSVKPMGHTPVQPPAAPLDPAPLHPAAIQQALRPFGQSRMLPRAAYVDPAVFAWEQQHLWNTGSAASPAAPAPVG